MAANILTTGAGAATSSSVVLAAGEALTIGLKGVTATYAKVRVELYDGSAWVPAGELNSGRRVGVLDGAGTYRFVRPATSGTCGVFSG